MRGRAITRWVGTVILLLLIAGPAFAERPAWLVLGEPWEQGIYDGIQEQDRERKRMRPLALVGKYQRLAARRAEQPEMVRRYYLLGRAHGLYYAELMAEIEAAATPSQKTQLAREARRSFDGAIRAYREALSIANNCYFCHHDMGILELQREQPKKDVALQYLRHATQINPKYPDPLRKTVLVLTGEKKWADAVPLLHKLIDLEPQDVLARVTLAGAYAETGQIETAYTISQQLLDYDPKNPLFQGLKAQLDFRSGKIDDAQKAYRALAEAHPTQRQWIAGYLGCLQWKEKNKKPTKPEDVLWALNGMLRLERDPARREQLREQLSSIKEQMAQGLARDPSKPPTADDLVRLMEGPDEEGRYRVISFLNAIDEAPPGKLLQGVLRRMSYKSEPSPRVRVVALEIAGKHFGFGFLPLLRIVGSSDPDPQVRVATIDAITRMAEMSGAVRSAAILNLATFVGDRSASVAAAARLSILNLGSGRLRLDENATDVQHRAAFERWWAGALGEDLKIRGLTAYPQVKDKWPEDILLTHIKDNSFFVRQAAHAAFAEIGAQLVTTDGAAFYKRERKDGYDRFRAWILSLPKPADGERLTETSETALRGAIDQWIQKRP